MAGGNLVGDDVTKLTNGLLQLFQRRQRGRDDLLPAGLSPERACLSRGRIMHDRKLPLNLLADQNGHRQPNKASP